MGAVMKIIEATDRIPNLIDRLLEVWESSVRATHLFLSDGEIKSIKEYVPQALKGIAHLMIAEDDAGRPVAFMGVEDGTLEMLFISPEELHVPSYIIDEVVKPSGCEYKEVRTMDEVLPELDVLYMTRVQRERFFNEEDYIRLKDSFILDAEKMKLAPKDLIVLHPLPRINEIAVEVDDDPRAKYFVQAQNSVYVRMALILMLLNIEPGLFEEETVC